MMWFFCMVPIQWHSETTTSGSPSMHLHNESSPKTGRANIQWSDLTSPDSGHFTLLIDLVIARANMCENKESLTHTHTHTRSILQERWQRFKKAAIKGAYCFLVQFIAECETLLNEWHHCGPQDLIWGNLNKYWQWRRLFNSFPPTHTCKHTRWAFWWINHLAAITITA